MSGEGLSLIAPGEGVGRWGLEPTLEGRGLEKTESRGVREIGSRASKEPPGGQPERAAHYLQGRGMRGGRRCSRHTEGFSESSKGSDLSPESEKLLKVF